ncbi:hypothetical protein EW145_g5964 [Phellinidium pouzarii]|uniref:THO1-MOS11 C-terminal domain-containing protein n=1 Tax=Phellinidium pouzarii TaxID=167371 RepID=A0A4S4KYA1_9AGAM|nr:hypothetical protein EW145_g5964 [Phellinidium pouzarii]
MSDTDQTARGIGSPSDNIVLHLPLRVLLSPYNLILFRWTQNCTLLLEIPFREKEKIDLIGRRALKVVDLKDILTRANVSIPAKANKPDLIAKISSSPAALSVFNELQGGGAKASGASTPRPAPPATVASPAAKVELELEKPSVEQEEGKDFLSPPEPFDWSASSETTSATGTKPASKSAATTTKPTSSTAAPTTPASNSATTAAAQVSGTDNTVVSIDEDEEAAKRRARAARFGISVVSPPSTPRNKSAAGAKGANGAKKAEATANGANGKKTPIKAGPVIDDVEKMNSRAARFGIALKTNTAKTPVTGQKRSAPAEDVDEEELERRRKRLERFGTGTKA